MTITYRPAKELDEIRLEIQRLKLRQMSLRAYEPCRRIGAAADTDDDPVERQLRLAFRHPRFFRRTGS